MKHGLRFVSLLTLLLFLLAACGGAQQQAQPAAEGEQTTAPASEEAETPDEEPTEAPAETTEAPEEETSAETTEVAETGEEDETSTIPDLGGRTIVIGSDTTYPPMEYIDEETMEIVGFDVDMMNEIAGLININIEFQTFPNFDAIFAALANKEFDVVVSSVSVTEERKKIIDFSEPYLSIGQVITVQNENTTIASSEDLPAAELVGVQGGTTGEEAAKKAGVPEENIKRYDTIDLAFQDLSIGAVDAVIADGPPSARYTAQIDSIKVIGEPFTTENYAIALQQGDEELKTAINAALEEMKTNGTLQALMQEWNLQDVASIPGAEEAASSEEPAEDAATEELTDMGGETWIVGSDTTYPPMEYVDEETKEIVGFDVDMMNEIGNRLNATIEFQTFPNFDAIFAALANKEFDLVVSSVSVTEERKEIIDFSDPYLSIGQVISTQKENETITSAEDLATAELVGVQGGTTGEEAAKKAGVPEENIKRYDTIDLAFQDLSIGAVDAVIADGPPSARYTVQIDNIQVVGAPFTTENYAIALQQEQPEMKAAINAALQQMKADGTFDELMVKWNLQDVASIP
jgi:polar amino acid transport system substrate-binding protein